ncbi:MAG TPA: TetR/AcrR family transcriptional regulator [Ktedonobacteraceae bacterium]|nr:TetR/AcrR family transcriptional regulator [Ktedonobacteraceae bacterium]
MEDAKKVSKRTDAVANRARILEAAHSVFAEHGLDLEMQEVAAQAGPGLGTLYGHFASREDLLRAIVQSVIDDTLAQMRAALVSGADDPRKAFLALASAALHVQHQYRPLFAVIRDRRLVKLMDPSYAQRVRMQFLEIPKDLLTQGIQAGAFPQDLDQDMASVTIMGAFINAGNLLGKERSPDELAQQLTQFLLRLFTGQASPEISGDGFPSPT